MYRENIYGILEGTKEKISAIIVPKNSGLKGYAWKVLKEAGLDIGQAERTGKDSARIGGLEVLFQRGEDIPKIVMDEFRMGRVALGGTGDDLYDEFRLRDPSNTLKVENTYDWTDTAAKFLRPALCLIGKQGAPLPEGEAKVALTAKYELTGREYLAKSPQFRGRAPKVNLYTGGLERAVATGANDIGIDVVYTGNSLEGNGLGIIDEIRFSDLVVISPLKREESGIGRAVRKEFERIRQRLDNPTDSYTSRLLADPEKAARKFVEEGYEFVQAYWGRGKMVPEMADVIYAAVVLATIRGCTVDDLTKEMLSRQK